MELESEHYSRIIFISILDLQKIKFNKLEQVCDKVYVFVDKEAKSIPFYLVQQLQHLGENVRWIAVDGNTSEAVGTHISYYLGKLDEQLEAAVEFAIISEDKGMDNLIQFINDQGQSCIRVTRNKQKETATSSDLNGITWSTQKGDDVTKTKLVKKEPTRVVLKNTEQELVRQVVQKETKATTATAVAKKAPNGVADPLLLSDRIAKETIKRLVLSGNRPAALESLKSYILLQYNSVEVKQQINVIIQKMEENKEIVVKNGAVVYNF